MEDGGGWGRMWQDGGSGMGDDAQIDHPARFKRYFGKMSLYEP